MKITIKILLFILLIASCKKDDDNSRAANTVPEAFTLLTVEDDLEDAALNPTFTWQLANDIDGDAVVYDLYLETTRNILNLTLLSGTTAPPDPTIILVQGLTETSYTITEALPINTSFTWKVVARDNQGGTVESEIFRFSTRLLNSREEAYTFADFDVRRGHGSVFFKDKFWVIGGFANIEDVKSDVWSSTDGIMWVEETANAAFSGRSQFGITVFQNRIFILGGLGTSGLLADVWSSADGVNWEQETTSTGFSPRAQTKLLNYRDKLYAIGGLDNPFDATTGSTKEVWSSTNGANWVQETSEAPYSDRFGFESLVFDDKMFVIGGGLAPTFEGESDVWYSRDGQNWTEADESGISFSERVFFNSTVFKDKIWLTGGYYEDAIEEIHYTDFWSSSDGIYWKREVLDAGYGIRSSATLVSNDKYMLFIGGENFSTNIKFNDVWKFD